MRRFARGTFPVRGVRDRRLSSLTLTETRYDDGESLGRHAHDEACIVVLFRGAFEEEYGGGRRACTAPTVLIRPPAEPHADRFGDEGGSALNVEVPSGWGGSRRDGWLPQASSELDGPERERLAFALVRAFNESRRDGLHALVAETLATWNRSHSPRPTPTLALRRARERVEREFRSPWSLTRVAAEVGLHPASLARAFRRTYGESLGQCVQRMRVRAACRGLVGSQARLADVALAAGFWDQAHFTRSFRTRVGVTPGEYRRLLGS